MSDHRREYTGKQRKAWRGFIDYDLAMLQEMVDTLMEESDSDIPAYLRDGLERLCIKMKEMEAMK